MHCKHVAVGDLDAVAGAAAFALQEVEQGAVAAAQVEHARALRHETRNEPLGGFVAHAANSLAMRSKYERTTPV